MTDVYSSRKKLAFVYTKIKDISSFSGHGDDRDNSIWKDIHQYVETLINALFLENFFYLRLRNGKKYERKKSCGDIVVDSFW